MKLKIVPIILIIFFLIINIAIIIFFSASSFSKKGFEDRIPKELKNKLSKRLFPIEIIDGKLNENDKFYLFSPEIDSGSNYRTSPFAYLTKYGE